MWVPVEADSRVKDQGPDVGDEEILRLVLLHILKLQLWKLLLTQQEKMMTVMIRNEWKKEKWRQTQKMQRRCYHSVNPTC